MAFPHPDRPAHPQLPRLVAALGIGQIISWGSFYYALAVLAPAIRADLGFGPVATFGAFSAGMVAMGLAAPAVGRAIDARGGRVVMTAGSVLAALAMAALSQAQGLASWIGAWLFAGIAMAMTFYEPAFATINQHAGPHFRKALTSLTLFGGFASTAFWPLTLWASRHADWRTVLLGYAALQLLVCLPLHRFAIPSRPAEPKAAGAGAAVTASASALPATDSAGASSSASPAPASPSPALRATFGWLATAFALCALAPGALSAHLIGLLQGAQLPIELAVAAAAMVGPSQVAGRIAELAAGARLSPVRTGWLSLSLLVIAMALLMALLAAGQGGFAAAAAFAVVYGVGLGTMTIVRGTVPAELFGREGYGQMLGRLGRLSFGLQALAPGLMAGVLVLQPAPWVPALLLLGAQGLGLLAYRAAIISSRRRL